MDNFKVFLLWLRNLLGFPVLKKCYQKTGVCVIEASDGKYLSEYGHIFVREDGKDPNLILQVKLGKFWEAATLRAKLDR